MIYQTPHQQIMEEAFSEYNCLRYGTTSEFLLEILKKIYIFSEGKISEEVFFIFLRIVFN
jgi:hypothetical protein